MSMERRKVTRSLSSQASQQGFSLIEVMVAVAVLSIGVTGIVSMQQAAHIANRQAQQLTIASNIARLWVERMRTDGLQWNAPSSTRSQTDLPSTSYLCSLVGCSNGGAMAAPGAWFVPTGPAGSIESAGFDYFGNEVPLASPRVHFCTNARLTWLRADTGTRQGMIRADVRVWWYRDDVGHKAGYATCGSSGSLQALGSDLQTLSFVYASSVIVGNPL